jgi:divalent metal cation (Fe/Co/Zn/Cd) transporter
LRVDRPPLLRRALRINAFLIGYNILEALLGVALGVAAGSIALVGFGLDGAIEAASAGILIWRLRHELRGGPDVETCGPERRALLVVGVTLVLLGVYVSVESVRHLAHRQGPESSLPGIVLAAVSLVLMPLLAWRKLAIARALGSRALHADGIQTALCSYLSLALLAGLGLNAACGWWWADAAAGLAMVPVIFKEGVEAVLGSRRHAPDCPRASA